MYGTSFPWLKPTKLLSNLTFGPTGAIIRGWLVVWHVDVLLVARVVATAWAVDFA